MTACCTAQCVWKHSDLDRTPTVGTLSSHVKAVSLHHLGFSSQNNGLLDYWAFGITSLKTSQYYYMRSNYRLYVQWAEFGRLGDNSLMTFPHRIMTSMPSPHPAMPEASPCCCGNSKPPTDFPTTPRATVLKALRALHQPQYLEYIGHTESKALDRPPGLECAC